MGVLPSTVLFIRSPNVFLFDNLFYHSIRSSEGLIGWWAEKLVLVVQLFLGSPEGNGLQWSFLFILGAAFLSGMPKRDPCRLAFQIAVFLCLICLLPTPTYLQYFSLCVPFLIVAAVCVVDDLYARMETKAMRRSVIAGAAIVLVLYVSISVKDLRTTYLLATAFPGCAGTEPPRLDHR